MFLNELVGYKSKPEYQAIKDKDSWLMGNLSKKLNELGYKKYELGSGLYATAYARPEDDFIIKLFREDRGYMEYLNFVTTHRNNPYVPKLKGKPIKLPNGYTIVRVEKLAEISMDVYMDINHFMYSTSPMLRKLSTFQLDKEYPGFTDLLTDLKKNAELTGVKLDMHSGNIMLRGKTPVVTDPYIWS